MFELFHLIGEKQPEDLQEFARSAKRNFKSSATDSTILEGLALIELKRKNDG